MLELSTNAETIYHFLSAYSLKEIRQALRAIGIAKVKHREHRRTLLKEALDKANWKLHDGPEPPKDHDYMIIQERMYVRKPPEKPTSEHGYVRSTASSKQTAVYTCPVCGDKVYSYKLCTACDKAKAGLTFSNTCSSCSFTFFTDEDPSKRAEDAL